MKFNKMTQFILIAIPFFPCGALANFSLIFNNCKNIISDGKTVDITPGSPYSMSCVETKNTYRCNIQYNNNTSRLSTFIKNVDPSGRMYFGTNDSSQLYQVNPKERNAMSAVRISTKTMLGTRSCSGEYMTAEETKVFIEKAKEAEKNPPPVAPKIVEPTNDPEKAPEKPAPRP